MDLSELKPVSSLAPSKAIQKERGGSWHANLGETTPPRSFWIALGPIPQAAVVTDNVDQEVLHDTGFCTI